MNMKLKIENKDLKEIKIKKSKNTLTNKNKDKIDKLDTQIKTI
jgi:hypothetical protein